MVNTAMRANVQNLTLRITARQSTLFQDWVPSYLPQMHAMELHLIEQTRIHFVSRCCPQLQRLHLRRILPQYHLEDWPLEGLHCLEQLRGLALFGFTLASLRRAQEQQPNLRMLWIGDCRIGGDLEPIGAQFAVWSI